MYLGIDFTGSGSFSAATNMLKDKANKALYTLKQSNFQVLKSLRMYIPAKWKESFKNLPKLIILLYIQRKIPT